MDTNYIVTCDCDVIESLKLQRNPEQYALLRHNNAATIAGVDDREMYNIVTVRELLLSINLLTNMLMHVYFLNALTTRKPLHIQCMY